MQPLVFPSSHSVFTFFQPRSANSLHLQRDIPCPHPKARLLRGRRIWENLSVEPSQALLAHGAVLFRNREDPATQDRLAVPAYLVYPGQRCHYEKS